MTQPPHVYLGPLDLPHFGVFFKGVRESLGLEHKHLAHFIGDRGTSRISRFESDGTRPGKIADILRILYPEQLGRYPVRHHLTDEEVASITMCYEGYLTTTQSEVRLATLDFDFLRREQRNGKQIFPALIERMHTCGYPAFLIDEFWFIHAINGATLYLFGLNPEAEYMRRWEFWHMLGTKFAPNSPVRSAHDEIERYYRPSVDMFFKSLTPYLFTIQARSVVNALHTLSQASNYEFSRYWHGAVTFSSRYHDDPRRRILRFSDARYSHQALHVTSEYDTPYNILDTQGHAASFMLGFWHPTEAKSQTQEVLTHIWDKPRASEVFYAADYDTKHAFHVNSWPRVQEHLLQTQLV